MGTPKYKVSRIKTIDDAVIEYVHIKGDGTPIILIPGAGDGLSMVGKFPNPYTLARMFKGYAIKHNIIIMSRREPIPKGYTVRDHARDYIWAMDELGIDKAHIETNSAGGPIGQWIAIDAPDRVRSLVLGASMAHTDRHLNVILRQWIEWSKDGEWYKLNLDSTIRTYTPRYYRKYRWLFPLLRLLPKPNNPKRVVRIFEGLLDFDNKPYLNKITCPTLVIGGDADEITSLKLQTEMARLIPDSKQIIIPGVGHGASQEANREHEEKVLLFYENVDKSSKRETLVK
ncbi:MAG TPA: alpha/beta hydrolase [Clostridia bacterium]|nr:alpha/beta hydrolase [Clostridia bacterium]